MKGVLKEVIEADGKIILFIDEIHNLLGLGKSEGAMDAGNLLKVLLILPKFCLVSCYTTDIIAAGACSGSTAVRWSHNYRRIPQGTWYLV